MVNSPKLREKYVRGLGYNLTIEFPIDERDYS